MKTCHLGPFPETQRETWPQAGPIADVKGHGTQPVSTRDKPCIAPGHQPIQTQDHTAMGMARKLQQHTLLCGFTSPGGLVIEQDDRGGVRSPFEGQGQIRRSLAMARSGPVGHTGEHNPL